MAYQPLENLVCCADLDGSLVHIPEHFPGGSLDSFVQAVGEFNRLHPDKRLDPEQIWNPVAFGTDDYRLTHIYPQLTRKEVYELVRLRCSHFTFNDTVPLPGAIEGMESIVRDGARVYALTGNPLVIARQKIQPFTSLGLMDQETIFAGDIKFPGPDWYGVYTECDDDPYSIVTKMTLLINALRLNPNSIVVLYGDDAPDFDSFNNLQPNDRLRLAYRNKGNIPLGFLFGYNMGECTIIGDPLFRMQASDEALHLRNVRSGQIRNFLNWFSKFDPETHQPYPGTICDPLLDFVSAVIINAYWPEGYRQIEDNPLKTALLTAISTKVFGGNTSWILPSYDQIGVVQSYFQYYR